VFCSVPSRQRGHRFCCAAVDARALVLPSLIVFSLLNYYMFSSVQTERKREGEREREQHTEL